MFLAEVLFNLLVIRGPTHSEGVPGIEPGSQSRPLPLRHRGWPSHTVNYLVYNEGQSFSNDILTCNIHHT